MKDLFVNKTFNFVCNNKELDHYNQVRIKYGLEVFYHFITKTSAVILISIIFNSFIDFILFSIVYMLLRSSSHGIHAKTNIGCWISSIITYSVIFYLLKISKMNTSVSIILFVIALISFLLWSPSDTEGRPLINNNSRKYLKIRSIVFLLLLILAYFMFSNLRPHIFYAIALQSLNINPFIYKIFRVPYNNYLSYKDN